MSSSSMLTRLTCTGAGTMTEDPQHRAGRWSAFYNEEDGLRDMLAHLGMTYLERMSVVEPWETEKLAKLAMAHKITKQLDGLVQAIISDGAVAEQNKICVERIEKLPHSKRRWI